MYLKFLHFWSYNNSLKITLSVPCERNLNNVWRIESVTEINVPQPPITSFGKLPVHLKPPKERSFISFETLGGGWTLVASISSSSNDHLLRAEVNCYNLTRCVEFTNTSIPCRKLSDQDIHEIATQEGIYRIS